jgi:hypothetical protein
MTDLYQCRKTGQCLTVSMAVGQAQLKGRCVFSHVSRSRHVVTGAALPLL